MIFLKLLLLCNLGFSYESSIVVKKSGESKVFKATVKAKFKATLSEVIKGIENFDDKCNNNRRSKRKYSKWEKNCSYHNENLVEAIKIQDFKKEVLGKEYPHAKYLMWRNIYNKGKFSHYDVITKDERKKSTIIKHQKLSEEIVMKLVSNPEKTVSAFEDIVGTYTVTQIDSETVQVIYTYESTTDHWFLTKDFLESNIKKNMVHGSEQAVKSIELSLKKTSSL